MSNATVSSQVYIIRNAEALAAVASGTMTLYADGTDLFAKDAAGNTYNLTHPSASNLSVALNSLTDVTVSGLTADSSNVLHVLRYDVGTSQWVNDDLDMELSDLSNVSNTAPSTNQVLQWNGTAWVPSTISAAGGGISALHEASDVIDYDSGTAPTTGQSLVWNATNSQFELASVIQNFTLTDGSNNVQVDSGDNITLTGISPISVTGNTGTSTFTVSFSGSLTDLSDTSASFTSLTAGQVLRYSGTAFTNAALSVFDLSNVDQNSVTLSSTAGAGKVLAWDQTAEAFVPVTQASGSTTLSGLTDVDTTGVANGDVLVYNSGTWEVVQSSSGITSVDKKLAWKFLPLVSLTNTNMSTNPSGTTDGLSQSFTPIYADATIGSTSTATQVVHLEGLLISDSTDAKEWYTAQGNKACLREFKFNHFNNGDTLDITMSLACYYVDATGIGYFISSAITKTLTLTGTINNTVAQFTLTAAELSTMLPANTTPAVGTVTAGKEWTCDAIFTFDKFSATATNATCTASDAHHNSGVRYAWIGFENVVPN